MSQVVDSIKVRKQSKAEQICWVYDVKVVQGCDCLCGCEGSLIQKVCCCLLNSFLFVIVVGVLVPQCLFQPSSTHRVPENVTSLFDLSVQKLRLMEKVY